MICGVTCGGGSDRLVVELRWPQRLLEPLPTRSTAGPRDNSGRRLHLARNTPRKERIAKHVICDPCLTLCYVKQLRSTDREHVLSVNIPIDCDTLPVQLDSSFAALGDALAIVVQAP